MPLAAYFFIISLQGQKSTARLLYIAISCIGKVNEYKVLLTGEPVILACKISKLVLIIKRYL